MILLTHQKLLKKAYFYYNFIINQIDLTNDNAIFDLSIERNVRVNVVVAINKDIIITSRFMDIGLDLCIRKDFNTCKLECIIVYMYTTFKLENDKIELKNELLELYQSLSKLTISDQVSTKLKNF
jgi:hypothetical protein